MSRLLSPSIGQQARKTVAAAIAAVPKPVTTASPLTTSVSVLRDSDSAIPEDAISYPHHVLKNGTRVGFQNPHASFSHKPNFASVFRQVAWPTITGERKLPDTTNFPVPVVKPEWLPDRDASDKLRATWLGHACYYLEFPSGLRILLDPVFEDRCSPLPFAGPKRYTPTPCTITDIPTVDVVVISHSHYDHLSRSTILELKKKHPGVHFLVGLGLKDWFHKLGIQNVSEFDWWEDADLIVKTADRTMPAKISCLPSQHGSARSMFDENTTLWCSWAISSGGKSVWFAGDTGYRGIPEVPPNTGYDGDFSHLPRCPQFEQIGSLHGPFDLGLIPIGAYSPRVAFSSVHANPYDAVDIFKDTRCERAMGIHWGTWALTLEEVHDPPRLLRNALRRSGISETGVFDVCKVGESREF